MSDVDPVQEKPDDRIATVEIDCKGCGAVVRSPFEFTCRGVFDSGTLIGNKLQCSSCGQMTACNKTNMRVVYIDKTGDISGGFVGEDVPSRDG